MGHRVCVGESRTSSNDEFQFWIHFKNSVTFELKMQPRTKGVKSRKNAETIAEKNLHYLLPKRKLANNGLGSH